MLGPLTIVSLDQGKLYGSSTTPEQAIGWVSPASDEVQEMARLSLRAAGLPGFLPTIRLLLARAMRTAGNNGKIPERGLTGR